MSPSSGDNLTRLHELLADRATQGLSEHEHSELATLLTAHPGEEDRSYEFIAAALDLPVVLDEARRAEPMPEHLRTRVENNAIGWLARSRGLSIAPAPEGAPASVPSAPTPVAVRTTPLAPLAPWLAAAACLLLAIAGWWPRQASGPAEPPAPTLARLYEQLKSSPSAQLASWNDVGDREITGDIIWDNATQTGVMRFRGLAVNDPAVLQYQLWIFDDARKQFTEFDAVDGGVFDIAQVGDEVLIRVRATLPVTKPYLFAVTTEPPGGVVKHVDSDDHQIVLTAEPNV
jgi:hypothetical protein